MGWPTCYKLGLQSSAHSTAWATQCQAAPSASPVFPSSRCSMAAGVIGAIDAAALKGVLTRLDAVCWHDAFEALELRVSTILFVLGWSRLH